MPPAVEKAKKELQEGEELCVSRQKLIRIVDRSEHGWITVNEYDELASNSDDEKRIYRAELRAAKKVKSAGQKAANKKKFNRGWKSFGGTATHTSTSQHLPRQFSASLPSGGTVLPHGVASSSLPVGARQVVGPCFQCGKKGIFEGHAPTYGAAK